MKLQTPVIMKDHIRHKSGKGKTVCVTACLTALGVPFENFSVTGTLQKPNFLSILNRHGMSTRSRKSRMSKSPTIASIRWDIAMLREPDCYYIVTVFGSGYCHAMVLDNKGQTVVDTDPRKADRRKVHSIHAVRRAV